MHSFHLNSPKSTFNLHDVVDNQKGDKSIHVKNVIFNQELFNITKVTEIAWEKKIIAKQARTEIAPRLEFTLGAGEDSDRQLLIGSGVSYDFVWETRTDVIYRVLSILIKGYEDDRLGIVLQALTLEALKIERARQILSLRGDYVTNTRFRIMDSALFEKKVNIYEGEELFFEFVNDNGNDHIYFDSVLSANSFRQSICSNIVAHQLFCVSSVLISVRIIGIEFNCLRAIFNTSFVIF